MDKDQFLIKLELEFESSTWEQILQLITYAEHLNIRDAVVDNIIEYVKQKNRLTFKQWKVIKMHVSNCEKTKLKFKYGN